MKRYGVWGILLLLVAPVPLAALEHTAFGPKSKRLGAGFHLGDPTGFSMKGYLSKYLAADGIVAWSFVEESLTFIGDVTYEFFDIPTEATTVTFPFYAGVGGKVAFDRAGKNNGRTIGAVRIPVGVAAQWMTYPIEVFFELSPGMEFAPETVIDVTGGIGARFFFF